MFSWFRFFLLVFVVLFLSQSIVGESCVVDLRDVSRGVHVSVETCRNIGTFSIGGLYGGNSWERLTYFYPKPWEGTFLSVRVGGVDYSNSMDSGDKVFMDSYIEKKPTLEGDRISMSWRLPGNVLVEQAFELVDGGVRVRTELTNYGSGSVSAGIRLHLDTMLGENDGAPVYIPGDGLKSEEKEYYRSSLDFEYWKAYNKEENATVIASGVLYGEGLTYPDKFIVADWKKSMYSSWDYDINPDRTILGDSAVLIYYNPRILEPNEKRTIVTVYKRGEPVFPFSKGSLGIADIVSSEVGGKHAPGDNVTMSVDVLSRGAENNTNVIIEVVGNGGDIIYIYNTTMESLEPDTVNPVEFNLEIPEVLGAEGSFEVTASVYRGGKRVDWRRKNFSIGKSEKYFLMLNDVRVGAFGEHGVLVEVDVGCRISKDRGELDLEIMQGGKIVHSSMKSTGLIYPSMVKTLNFTWTPEEPASNPIILIISLYKNFKKIDEISREFSLDFHSNESTFLNESTTLPKGGGGGGYTSYLSTITPIILLIFLVTVFLFINPLTREKSVETTRRLYGYMKEVGSPGDVVIEKRRDGENIRLVIKNNSRGELKNCVVEDNIPKGIDATVSAPNIIGKGGRLIILKSDKFIWNVGNISPGDTVVLKYRLMGGMDLLPAKLRWDSGEKTTY